MRRNLVAQAERLGRFRGCIGLHLAVQQAQLRLQQVDLLLLLINRAIEFFHEVFSQADLDFEFGQAIIHDVRFRAELSALSTDRL